MSPFSYTTARLRVDDAHLLPAIRETTPLEYLIPTTTGAGACTTALVDFLVQVHNSFIERCRGIVTEQEKRWWCTHLRGLLRKCVLEPYSLGVCSLVPRCPHPECGHLGMRLRCVLHLGAKRLLVSETLLINTEYQNLGSQAPGQPHQHRKPWIYETWHDYGSLMLCSSIHLQQQVQGSMAEQSCTSPSHPWLPPAQLRAPASLHHSLSLSVLPCSGKRAGCQLWLASSGEGHSWEVHSWQATHSIWYPSSGVQEGHLHCCHFCCS